MKSKINFQKKSRIITQFILSIVILVLGVNLMIRSNLGPAPWDTFTYHLHVFLSVTLGMSALIIQTVLITIIIIIRKSMKYLYIFSSIITIAIAFDFWDLIVFRDYYPESIYLRVTFYLVGIFLLSFGLALLVLTRFKATVIDELMLIMMEKLNTKNVFFPRMTIESIGLTLGLLTGFVAGLGWGLINQGTVFVTLVLPFFLSIQMRWMTPVFDVNKPNNLGDDLADLI